MQFLNCRSFCIVKKRKKTLLDTRTKLCWILKKAVWNFVGLNVVLGHLSRILDLCLCVLVWTPDQNPGSVS